MKLGQTGKLKGELPKYLIGAKVRIIAISPRTGGLTVAMLEDAGLYFTGQKLNVKPYEFEKEKLK